MRSRDTKIDAIKGLGIILVVLGHTQMSACSFVNLFHVGLFFVASGFCYKEKYSDTWSDCGEFLRRRIKGLYIPFVLWNTGYLCFRNIFAVIGIYNTSQIGLRDFIKQLIEIVLLRAGEQLAGPCWFVRALLILEVLFVLSDRIMKRIADKKYIHILRAGLAVGILLLGAWLNSRAILLQYNLSTVCSAWILYVAGVEFRYWKEKKGIDFQIQWKNAVLMLVSFCILVMMNAKGSISYDSNSYPNVVFFLVAAMAGWGMTWGFATFVVKLFPMLSKSLAYVGRRTMSILFLHLLCFKVISAGYVYLNGMGRYVISDFPVITNDLWFWYWVAGVGLPLLIDACAQKVTEKFKDWSSNKKYIVLSTGCILLCVISNFVSHTMSENLTLVADDALLDYSLIYDENYYLSHNQDVALAIANNEEAFKHFVVNGMAEGRIASENFDVYYYKEQNKDLEEFYGENLCLYYQHFMLYGHAEGRKGSATANTIYDIGLEGEIVDENKIKFTIIIENHALAGEEYYIFGVPAYQKEIKEEMCVMQGTFNETDNIILEDYDVREHLNDKYVLAKKADSGFVIISNYAYLNNAESLCDTNIERPIPDSKKGLQITNSMIADVEELQPSFPFMNLIIENIMCPDNEDGNAITYQYQGRKYYFRSDVIEEYDRVISELTQNGAVVTASVISIKSEGFDELYYSGISMDTDAAFYAINTATEAGQQYLEAFVSFMSNRYNGTLAERGLIANWVVGNEVNESGTYNYMGEKEINEYLKEYTRTFRIVYNIVKSNIAVANVYVPMEPWWGIDSNNLTYGGREFLNLFNQIMCREGNIDWGLAYHAYSFPLNDPKY